MDKKARSEITNNEVEIKFKPGGKLQNFIENFIKDKKNKIINVVADKDASLLTLAKINGVLPGRSDAYIFIKLDYLVLTEKKNIQGKVRKAFREGVADVLIMDCTESNISKENIEQLSESEKLKKIILVTKEGNTLANLFKDASEVEQGLEYKEYEYGEYDHKVSFKEYNGKISFNDLTLDSQKEILKKEVIIFQGEKTSLGKLIDKEDKKSKEIIDSEVLLKLINPNEKIEIGIKRPDLSDLESIYYVTHAPMEKEQFLSAVKNNLSNLFVISGTTEPELSSHENIIFIDKDKDEEKSLENFKRVCSDDPKRAAHLIEKKGNKLTWKRSYDASFYITRKLDHVVIKEDSLRACTRSKEYDKMSILCEKYILCEIHTQAI